jgi:hypothetical protein
MTAVTTGTIRLTSTAAPAAIWRIVRFMAFGVRAIIAGYWLVMVVAFALLGLVIHLATGATEKSVWDFAANSPKYFSSAVGMMLTPAFLTRGWSQAFENPHLFTKSSQAALIFLEFFLLIMSHQVAGWLIASSFYRFGIWTGLAMLPLGLIPAAAAELLLLVHWVAQALQSTGWHRPSLLVAVPGVLLVCALGLYANHLLIRLPARRDRGLPRRGRPLLPLGVTGTLCGHNSR